MTTWNDNTIVLIYEAEVLEIAKDTKYCGMWQFYQVSNIVCQPIRSIYPVGYRIQTGFKQNCLSNLTPSQRGKDAIYNVDTNAIARVTSIFCPFS